MKVGPMPSPQCSLVIPVFNGAHTIGAVVAELRETFQAERFEIVLVDDGSGDGSAAVCRDLAERFPETVRFVGLARNFGEHNAVLAGLRHCCGEYAVILDDDGQQPAREARRLFEAIRAGSADVVYGRYAEKHHGSWRNLGSRVNGWLAVLLLDKPPDLYLSSFKAINRLLIDEICAYRGQWPYVDALVLWATRRIEQLDVDHRWGARSSYTTLSLIRAWSRAVLSFSILPLRAAALLGFVSALLSGAFLVWVIIQRLWFNPHIAVGLPTLGVVMAFFAGVQMLMLGAIGEYVGRLFLSYAGVPQYVVREVRGGQEPSRDDH